MIQDIKSKTLDLALSQIEKQFGKGSIMKLGEQAIEGDIPMIPMSLLKNPSEAEFERLRGISIELIRSGEAGCNPNVKAIGPGSRSKNLRYLDPQTAA
jgi:hypothetical protein